MALLLVQVAQGKVLTAAHRIGRVSGIQISAGAEVASREQRERQVEADLPRLRAERLAHLPTTWQGSATGASS